MGMIKNIKDFIEDETKKGLVTVSIYESSSKKLISNLSFKNGKFEGIEGTITIDGYLNRIIQHCRKDINIYINNVLLTDIKPREIYLIEHIPELPKSS